MNRYPIGHLRHEVLITKRKVQYEIRQLNQNEIFGHQELIKLIDMEANYEDEEKRDEVVRTCRVKAKTGCEVIYLNKDYFARCK